jgi:transglutaminase-like putative cysteine protease
VTFVAIVLLAGIAAQTRAPALVPTRQFEFTYKVTVPALPAGSAPLHLWIPLPPSDALQTINRLKIDSPIAHKIQSDREYGNRFAYFVVPTERASVLFDITLRFQATRREHRVALAGAHPAGLVPAKFTPEIKRSLAPDHMVPLDGVIAELAHQQLDGTNDPLQQARKAYDYVVATMKYDKTGQGWGRGDAVWACDSKRGNCTDFHSVLIGMMRTKGIPARFEIGFPLPDNKSEGDIPGYHCWAEFYIEGIGWVPVDASEAWKHPDRRDYFFGAHDDNRVLFTRGRDIRLGADQKGAPLNYFIYPYAEQDGKPAEVKSQFAFRDIRPAPGGAAATSATGQR